MKVVRLDSRLLVEELGQMKTRVSKGYGVTIPYKGRSTRPSLGLNGPPDPEEDDEGDVDDAIRGLLRLKIGRDH